MSDWKLLNEHRISEGDMGSTPDMGFNGAFRLKIDGRWWNIIASDGYGWQHVSVSCDSSQKSVPTWRIMCMIKDLFWEPEDAVVQYHPAKSEYVNHHPGCLHLFRPTVEKLPVPSYWMVGPKGKKHDPNKR